MALHRSYPINVCKYTGMKECSHQSACIDRTLQTPPIWKIESWYRIFSSQSYVVDLFYWSILNQRPVRALSWDNEARARVAVLESIIITYRLRELNLSCWTLTYVGVSISCTTYTSANSQISLNTLCLSSLWKSSYTSRQPHQRHFWKRFSWGTFLKMKTYVQRTPVLPVWGPVIQAPLSIFWHPQSPGIIRTRRADYKRNFEEETFFSSKTTLTCQIFLHSQIPQEEDTWKVSQLHAWSLHKSICSIIFVKYLPVMSVLLQHRGSSWGWPERSRWKFATNFLAADFHGSKSQQHTRELGFLIKWRKDSDRSVVVILFRHSRSFSEGSLKASASRQKASFKISKQN